MSSSPTVLGRRSKRVASRKRYVIDFSDWVDSGETVTNCVFTVTTPATAPGVGTALSVDDDSILSGDLTVAFFVNDGEAGVTYTVHATVTTSGGQVEKFDILFSVVA